MMISLNKISKDYKGMDIKEFRKAMHNDYNGKFDNTIGKFVSNYKQGNNDTVDDILNNYFKK